jgi:hypothetical protein
MGQPSQIHPEPVHEEDTAALHAKLETELRARGVAPFSTVEDFWRDAGIRTEQLSDDDLRAFSELPELLQKIREEDRSRAQ